MVGLFDKFKGEFGKTQNYLNIDKKLSFCSCGNITSRDICEICATNMKNKKKYSPNELNRLWLDKFLIPLSERYNENFEQISLKDYFKLDETQESHIIYRILRNIVFNEFEGDICTFFNEILKETKNNENIIKSIVNNIRTIIIDEFYDGGFKYTRSISVIPSEHKIVKNTSIKNKHGTGTKVLATAIAGPIGYAATSGIKQTTEVQRKIKPGKYMNYEYLFNPDYIGVKFDVSYNSDNTKNFENEIIVKFEDIEYIDDNSLFLKSGDTIQLYPPLLIDETNKSLFDVVGTFDGRSNSRLKSKYLKNIMKETSLLLDDLIKEYFNNVPKLDNNNQIENDSNDSLENLVKMYEKGLLTDEEFISMKKKIVDN